MKKRYLVFTVYLIFLIGCKRGADTPFEILSVKNTGVYFNNQIDETEIFNILTYEYYYNGGGVGVGDFDNDGLQDLFFAGNIVNNRLYLNKGDFRFLDVSEEAGIQSNGIWCTSVAVIDLNYDGFLDIYVAASALGKEKRRNILFINQGLNEHGVPVFLDKASEYGIDDDGYSTNAVFFDCDNDFDMDLYVLTNQVESISPNKYRLKENNGQSPSNDRLYRNNNDGTFTNITRDAGINYEGYGLGISITDINQDGWKDIYVTNDYMTNDVLYINNQDGTFSNEVSKYIKHQAHSAMGHDVADINNDGFPELFALDMLPADHQEMKQMMLETRFNNYMMNDKFGYDDQYIRNVLQLNNGIGPNGEHNFSDISFYSGIYASYWSWSPLFADYNNDGFNDLFISNGFPKDVTDLDFGAFRGNKNMAFNKKELLGAIPAAKVYNYLLVNNHDLTFTNKAKEWGLDQPTYSNGAVFADLDNDGDLDIVTNNINDPALVIRNNAVELDQNKNYLRIKFQGPKENPGGIGAKVTLWTEGSMQYSEFSPYRGYASSVEQFVHFGLGNKTKIDSIEITWIGNKSQKVYDITANQVLTLKFDENLQENKKKAIGLKPLFRNASSDKNLIQYMHADIVFSDFNIQLIMPHQLSQYGPALSTGDIDGNGLEDLFIGGSLGIGGTFFIQKSPGMFEERYFQNDHKKEKEDLGTLLFDADNDGDLDLYIVSGSYEQELKPQAYADRIYKNDGKGNFTEDKKALPDFLISGSCVKAADYDKDGDLDLFIGGRVQPGKYPLPVNSYILRNISTGNNILFEEVTPEICPDLQNIGLVTDAIWTDFNNDYQVDLVVVGEWMPLTFFENQNGKFTNITENSGISEHTGWWNSITGSDFDNDGDIDYIAGNLGSNSFFKASLIEPMVCYADDYGNDGSMDPIIGTYAFNHLGERNLYPVHALNDLRIQVVPFRKRFTSFAHYAETPFEEILTAEEKAASLRLTATQLKTCFIENLGEGKFKIKELPAEAQFAPVFGSLNMDVNEDGYDDVILVGNDYGNTPYWGKYDAFNGLILINQGDNNFEPLSYRETGFFVDRNAKALVQLETGNSTSLIIASQNQDSLKVFEHNYKLKAYNIPVTAAWGESDFNGKLKKHEFYWGNSFLSQSTRTLYLPKSVSSVRYVNYAGTEIK